jgi:DNA-binding LacI/PurR family transcriptional regulator
VARVRLVDVARRVGVSAKTVSNVVNGTGAVSEQKRDEILAVIEELGYRPNRAARQLRTGSSGLVALGMPDLREPYFAEFAAAFFTAAQQRGLTVVVWQTHGDRKAEKAFCEGEGMPEVEGIVMSPLALTPGDIADRRSAVPLVLIGETGHGLATAEVPHVGVDNIEAARAATRLLLSRGRRRIAVIGAQKTGSTATSRMRLEGYRRALHEAGIAHDPSLVGWVTEFNRAEGSAAAERLLASGSVFDGLFCFNDSLAFGALYTLATHGIIVPDQIAVIGFDAIEEGRFSMARFASIDPNSAKVSQIILDLIVSGVRGPLADRRYVAPFAIVDHALPVEQSSTVVR